MAIRKPVWCTCKGHSWTRRQLLSAWENNRPVTCPEANCRREIAVDDIEILLKKINILDLGAEGVVPIKGADVKTREVTDLPEESE